MAKKLFIQIPKNGGMTIRHKQSITKKKIIEVKPGALKDECQTGLKKTMERLGRAGENPTHHARWRDVKDKVKQGNRAFAIIRNPWDRVVSRYSFGLIQNWYDMSFEQFVEDRFTYQGSDRDYTWHLAVYNWFPAYDYVIDENNNLVCDCIRFEHYNEDVVKYFGLPDGTTLDIRNVSNGAKSHDRKKIVDKKPYQEFYNSKTIQIIADWYKVDIETWGFDFDTSATKNYWNKK